MIERLGESAVLLPGLIADALRGAENDEITIEEIKTLTFARRGAGDSVHGPVMDLRKAP